MGAESQRSFDRDGLVTWDGGVRPILLGLPKAYQVAMERQKTYTYSDGSLRCASSLLGLLVFLPYFLRAVIYPFHFTRIHPPASYEPSGTRILVMCQHSETPAAVKRHDNPCPICKAALGFQDYSVSSSLPLPGTTSLVRLIFSGDPIKDLPAFLRLFSAIQPKFAVRHKMARSGCLLPRGSHNEITLLPKGKTGEVGI